MNVLADFINRVNSLYPEDLDNEELNSLLTNDKKSRRRDDTLRKKIDMLELSKVNKKQQQLIQLRKEREEREEGKERN